MQQLIVHAKAHTDDTVTTCGANDSNPNLTTREMRHSCSHGLDCDDDGGCCRAVNECAGHGQSAQSPAPGSRGQGQPLSLSLSLSCVDKPRQTVTFRSFVVPGRVHVSAGITSEAALGDLSDALEISTCNEQHGYSRRTLGIMATLGIHRQSCVNKAKRYCLMTLVDRQTYMHSHLTALNPICSLVGSTCICTQSGKDFLPCLDPTHHRHHDHQHHHKKSLNIGVFLHVRLLCICVLLCLCDRL